MISRRNILPLMGAAAASGVTPPDALASGVTPAGAHPFSRQLKNGELPSSIFAQFSGSEDIFVRTSRDIDFLVEYRPDGNGKWKLIFWRRDNNNAA